MSDSKQRKFGKIVLKGTFKYPKLNDPDTKFAKDGFGVYTVKVVLPKDDEHAEALMAQIDAAYDENMESWRGELPPAKAKKLVGADKPYRMEEDRDTGEETGNVEFTCKMKAGGKRADGSTWEQQPDLFDARMNRLTENIGGGTLGRVSCFLTGWNSPNPKIGCGVSLKLRGVQVIDLHHGSGTPEDLGFEAEEDGFVSSGKAVSVATSDEGSASDFEPEGDEEIE